MLWPAQRAAQFAQIDLRCRVHDMGRAASLSRLLRGLGALPPIVQSKSRSLCCVIQVLHDAGSRMVVASTHRMRSDPARTARRASSASCWSSAGRRLEPAQAEASPAPPTRPAPSREPARPVGDLRFLRFRTTTARSTSAKKDAVKQEGDTMLMHTRRRPIPRERRARGRAEHSRRGVPVPALIAAAAFKQGPAADGRRLRSSRPRPQVLGRQAARVTETRWPSAALLMSGTATGLNTGRWAPAARA